MRVPTRTVTRSLAVLALGALTLASIGCGGDSSATYVVVNLEQGTAPAGVNRVELDLMLDGRMDTVIIDNGGTALPFPLTDAIKLNQGQGTLTVKARALMGTTEVATGTTPVFITRGSVTPVTVTFGVTILPSDGGVPDAGPANDGAPSDGPPIDRPTVGDGGALTTIQRIRMGMVASGAMVDLGDVVVVAGFQNSAAIRIWVQDEGGGPNHGMQLFCRLPCATFPTAADAARFMTPGIQARVTGMFTAFMPPNAPWPTLEVENPMMTQTGMGRPVVAIDVGADMVDLTRNGVAALAPYMGSYVRVSSVPAGSTFTPNLMPMQFVTMCPGLDGGTMQGFFGIVFATPSMANIAVDTSFFHNAGYLMYCNNACVTSCVQRAQATDRFSRISGILEQQFAMGSYLQVIATRDSDFVR